MRPAALARAAALALALAAAPAAAQQGGAAAPATLVADRVGLDAEGRLVAEGAVEALQGDTRMTAERIVYDPDTGALTVAGPITLAQGAEIVLLADAAELSRDLREGLLRSARLVLDRQLQLAAAEIARSEGRYTRLSRVVASSCEVCAASPVPLWQIRASRIVHDARARQLYFENARFEIRGVPVLFLPRLRLPDPTVERATGLLAPRFTQTDELGFGVKAPYFIALSPSRDLTLTPYVSARSATLEGRYRQAFRRGRLQLDGALSRDELRPDETRGYLFGEGAFRLPGGTRLRFDVESASDAAYLSEYGYSGKTRLDSALALTRTGRDRLFEAEGVHFAVPGADRDSERRPSLVGDAQWQRRFTPGALGGTARLRLAAHGHERPSGEDGAGRDIGRLEAELGWRRDAVLAGGLLLAAESRLLAQRDAVGDDSAHPDPETRLIPAAALELRWPLAARRGGAAHLLEPVAQLVWTGEAALTDRPAEESRQVTLDPGNLFGFSRFPAGDRVEAGARANLGLGYTRHDPAGWALGLSVGRVLRAGDEGQFDGIAALDGARSDWLVAARLGGDRLHIDGRALIDDDREAGLLETRFGWQGPRLDLAGSYSWLAAAPAEERPDPVNQWRLDGALRVDDRWRASADVAWDLERERAADAAFGLEYRANCVTVDVGLRRRFTAAGQDEPTTSVDLQIALAGFGGGAEAPRPRNRACLR